jgi:hypothetical protein
MRELGVGRYGSKADRESFGISPRLAQAGVVD